MDINLWHVNRRANTTSRVRCVVWTVVIALLFAMLHEVAGGEGVTE